MKREEANAFKIPLFFSRSKTSTESNKTGSWSFIQPSYQDKTAPCSAACPCGTDIPRVEAYATEGKHDLAWRTILMENPLPGVCGRVCFHPCEKACNRGELDTPIAINNLERFLADTAFREEAATGIGPGTATGKRVAILGSGPAGLSAAYFLARLGHACEIFEAAPEPGGILRWGIPAYRLPSAILTREIEALKALGVKITCNAAKDETFSCREQGFDGLIVACGQGKPYGLGVPGEELAKDGLELLRVTRAKSDGEVAPPSGLRAAVIGGGNTAIDVARTLVRCGVKPVIVYRRRREDMPAFGHEVERALAEGVELLELQAPLALAREGEGLKLSLQKMRSTEPGADGRRRIEALPGETSDLFVAHVYAAIGAETAPGWAKLLKDTPRKQFGRSSLAFGPAPWAFVGDLSTDEKSVADAIGSGKEAALALDAFFAGGEETVADRLAACRVGGGPSLSMELYLGGGRSKRDARVVCYADINAAYFPPRDRAKTQSQPPGVSVFSFDEVEEGLGLHEAGLEAERCFSCGTCNGCDQCQTFCPEVAARFEGGGRRIDTDYCKGCGVCVEECPRSAMTMGMEDARR
jgi:NADPH-dependent glutamate synthase beta subunit-like oxidoreductase